MCLGYGSHPYPHRATAECLKKLQVVANANKVSLQDVLQRELIKVGEVRSLENPPHSAEPGLQHFPLESKPLTHRTSTLQWLERCDSPTVLRTESENPVKATLGLAVRMTLLLALMRQYL